MLRSFHYAAYAAFLRTDHRRSAALGRGDLYPVLAPVGVGCLPANLSPGGGRRALHPADRKELKTLLDAYLLSKAVYELGYELNNRPHWVAIPLQGILQTLQAVQ